MWLILATCILVTTVSLDSAVVNDNIEESSAWLRDFLGVSYHFGSEYVASYCGCYLGKSPSGTYTGGTFYKGNYW